jgi:hypothetical protein
MHRRGYGQFAGPNTSVAVLSVLYECRFESLERCFTWSSRPEQKPFQDEWVSSAAQAGGSAAAPVTSSMQEQSAAAAAAEPTTPRKTSSNSSGAAASNGDSSSPKTAGTIINHGRVATEIKQ